MQQRLATQRLLALKAFRHLLLQKPQFEGSVARLTHWVLLQFVSPLLQASTHLLLLQSSAPLVATNPGAVTQAPQPPQCSGLVEVSTHAFPHTVRGAGQSRAHRLVTQSGFSVEHFPVPNGAPIVPAQTPQLAESLVRSTQRRAGPMPHGFVPVGQFSVHAPRLQRRVPSHRFPQVPQLVGSVWRSTHLAPQTLDGGGHWFMHTDLTQKPPGHPAPHAPQCAGSESRLTHDSPHLVAPGQSPETADGADSKSGPWVTSSHAKRRVPTSDAIANAQAWRAMDRRDALVLRRIAGV